MSRRRELTAWMRRTWFYIQHHLHGLFPERHHRVEACEVEVVLDEVLGNLAEILVSGERTEPANPC